MADYTMTEEDLLALPLWARVAFAARCARRVQLFSHGYAIADDQIEAVERAISLAEYAAETATLCEGYEAYKKAVLDRSIFRIAEPSLALQEQLPPGIPPAALAAGYAAWAADRDDRGGGGVAELRVDEEEGVFRAYAPEGSQATAAIWAACAASVAAEKAAAGHVLPAIFEDYMLLVNAAEAGDWTDTTPVALEFFALNVDFSENILKNRTQLIDVCSGLRLSLLEALKAAPEQMPAGSLRAFEELAAEVLKGSGFSVEFACRTHARDQVLIAIWKSLTREGYLVEFERHASSQEIDVAFVQRLHGVSETAIKEILATTSDLTDAANGGREKQRYLLEGRSFSQLVAWLRKYDSLRLGREVDH